MTTKSYFEWMAWCVTICGTVAACSAADLPDDPVESSSEELRKGRVCGGPRHRECSDEQFCQARLGECPGKRHPGRCVNRPEVCTKEYAPVCGCDGVTYGNRCQAASAGVSIASNGECEPAPTFCGGIAGFPCPDGLTCVDDPSDECDPNSGGADCGGICVTPGACGKSICGPGMVCCNALLGICTEPGRVCIQ